MCIYTHVRTFLHIHTYVHTICIGRLQKVLRLNIIVQIFNTIAAIRFFDDKIELINVIL